MLFLILWGSPLVNMFHLNILYKETDLNCHIIWQEYTKAFIDM